MSNQDVNIALAHIILSLIFAIGGYILYFLAINRYFDQYENVTFIIVGLLAIIFWDIILGDLASTISIGIDRKEVIKNLNSYQRQEFIHALHDDYNEIYKAHCAIFSIKIVLLVIAFIDSFILLTNCRKVYEKFDE